MKVIPYLERNNINKQSEKRRVSGGANMALDSNSNSKVPAAEISSRSGLTCARNCPTSRIAIAYY